MALAHKRKVPNTPASIGATRRHKVTDESTLGELPRFSRDIAVTSAPRRDQHRVALGVLEPFSGLLNGRVERDHPPRPDLSYLTLAPLVAAAHGRGETTGTITSRTSERPSGEPLREKESDAGDDAEPTVREVLDREAASGGSVDRGVRGSGPDRTLMDTPNHAPSRRGWPTGDETGSRSDRAETRDDSGPSRDVGSGPFPPSLTTVDVTRFGDRSPGGPVRTTGRPVPGDAGGTPGADFRGDVAPAAMTLRGASGDATGNATRGSRERQTGSRPEPSDRRGRPGRGSADAGPRLTVRSESVRSESAVATDADEGGSGDAPGDPTVTDTGGPSASSEAGVASVARGEADVELSSVLAASADPESRLVDRLFRALKERQAIERRRRGGR